MPRSSLSAPTPTQLEITQPTPANKAGPPITEAASPQLFTPWAKLIAFAADPRRLDVPAAVARFLALCLQHAGPLGRGDGTDEHEAMFWTRREQLAAALGCTPATVTRSARHLIQIGVLRVRRVEALQPLPSGQRATRPCSVFYVHVGRLSMLVGLSGTVRADGIKNDPSNGIKNDPTPRPKSRDFSAFPGAPCESLSRFPGVVKDLNQRSQDLRGGGREGDRGSEFQISNPETESVIAYWWAHVGKPRLGGEAPRGSVLAEVRRAVEAALSETWTAKDCCDAVDGVCDRELGGPSFDYCRDRRVWTHGIFAGCLPKLVEQVRANRARIQRDAQKLAEPYQPRTDVPAVKPPWLPDSVPARPAVRVVRRS
jgi:hypothetical protein